MNHSLQTWSPRTRPLNYDALLVDVGCQDTQGNQVFASKPFVRLCIVEHATSGASVFNRLATVSYATGPQAIGDGMPWEARWSAWVSNTGIRVAKVPLVTPPASGTGSASALYPTTKPAKLSLGFTSQGEIAIAIQKDAAHIEIKWTKDSVVETELFAGVSPALFNNGLLHSSDAEGETDLVLYYLRASEEHTLFARFEREDFAVEYVVNDSLQTNLVSLITSEVSGDKQLLYGRDQFGRDVTLYSPSYITTLDGDALLLSASLRSIRYLESAIEAERTDDALFLSASLNAIHYFAPIILPSSDAPLSADKGTLIIGINSIEYS